MKTLLHAALALLVLAIAAITSCNQKDPPQGARVKVRIGYLPIAADLPLFVALENKAFEGAGFDVEAVRFTSSNELASAAVAGRVDAMMSLALNAAFDSSTASGKHPRLFGANIYSDQKPHVVDYLVARTESGIHQLGDLRGKRIGGFPGSVTRIFVSQVLLGAGLQPTDYTYVELAPQDWEPSLQSGAIDAASVMEPQFSQIIADGAAEVVIEGFFAKLMPDVPLSGQWLSEEFASARSSDEIESFVGVYDSAIEYIRREPAVARLKYSNYVAVRPEVLPNVQLNRWLKSSEIEPERIQKYADLLHRNGGLQQAVQVKSYMLQR